VFGGSINLVSRSGVAVRNYMSRKYELSVRLYLEVRDLRFGYRRIGGGSLPSWRRGVGCRVLTSSGRSGPRARCWHPMRVAMAA